MLSLRQYVNDPKSNFSRTLANIFTEEDYRALCPLFYSHVNPYGMFELDMNTRIPMVALH